MQSDITPLPMWNRHKKKITMIKYIKEETLVAFSEIPEEITLCVNISNCCNNCAGCHSPYLANDIGDELNAAAIDSLIKSNDGISCFCFMGEGNNKKVLQDSISYINKYYPSIKTALYSGRKTVPEDFYWENLDYLKIGPYIEECGPLNKETTNQRLYMNTRDSDNSVIVDSIERKGWTDITYKFWRK